MEPNHDPMYLYYNRIELLYPEGFGGLDARAPSKWLWPSSSHTWALLANKEPGGTTEQEEVITTSY